jgi:glycosyltransferase involved in cell wall biosynthesis
VKVLYVNHTATIGGAERSLLELLAGLPDDVSPALACPDGPLVVAARKIGVPVLPIPSTALSFRLHPLHTPQGLVDLGRAAIAVRQRARRFDADLIHANTVRAGLVAAPLRRIGGPPVVAHVRDCLPRGAAAELTRRAIGSGSALVLTNSDHTAASFAPNGSRARIRTVHNSVDLDMFDPAHSDRAECRSRLGLAPSVAALGVIAQITPWKAQDDAIRALASLRQRSHEAVLLLVGETKFVRGSEAFDNVAFERSLHGLVEELGLDASVKFLGERADVPEILSALDLVLVPSWEEPFGRSAIEAMAMAVPVIATSVGGPAEIISHDVDGLLLPPRQPELWAEAAADLLETPGRLQEMGSAARRTAVARFGREEHVRAVLAAYGEALKGAQR